MCRQCVVFKQFSNYHYENFFYQLFHSSSPSSFIFRSSSISMQTVIIICAAVFSNKVLAKFPILVSLWFWICQSLDINLQFPGTMSWAIAVTIRATKQVDILSLWSLTGLFSKNKQTACSGLDLSSHRINLDLRLVFTSWSTLLSQILFNVSINFKDRLCRNILRRSSISSSLQRFSAINSFMFELLVYLGLSKTSGSLYKSTHLNTGRPAKVFNLSNQSFQ